MRPSRRAPSQEEIAPLFARLASGDREALAAIYDAVAGWLLEYLIVITGSQEDGEDCLQEVFVRLVRSRRRLRKVENLCGYLFSMARNEAFRKLQRRNPHEHSLSSVEVRIIADQHECSESFDLADALSRGLRLLSPEQREVVVLRTYHELSFEEIGRLAEVPTQTAASRYRYALRKLETFLRGQGYE